MVPASMKENMGDNSTAQQKRALFIYVSSLESRTDPIISRSGDRPTAAQVKCAGQFVGNPVLLLATQCDTSDFTGTAR